jgi:translation initiation factor 3 subunit D
MTAYALNEWDSKLAGAVEWRQKIDSQRGAVLATELKNNSAKLAKWTAQSIIAGADQVCGFFDDVILLICMIVSASK